MVRGLPACAVGDREPESVHRQHRHSRFQPNHADSGDRHHQLATVQPDGNHLIGAEHDVPADRGRSRLDPGWRQFIGVGSADGVGLQS